LIDIWVVCFGRASRIMDCEEKVGLHRTGNLTDAMGIYTHMLRP